jgi:hypothetical protein
MLGESPGETLAGGSTFRTASAPPVGVQIRVTPPPTARVGEWGELRVEVRPDRDVPEATVKLTAPDSVRVEGGEVLYQGPLSADRVRVLGKRVQARTTGEHRLEVALLSPTPGLATSVSAEMHSTEAAPETSSDGLTHRRFRAARLEDAAALVAEDCDLRVMVDEAVGPRRVTADFSAGVAGPRAVRVLAQMTGAELIEENGVYQLLPGF